MPDRHTPVDAAQNMLEAANAQLDALKARVTCAIEQCALTVAGPTVASSKHQASLVRPRVARMPHPLFTHGHLAKLPLPSRSQERSGGGADAAEGSVSTERESALRSHPASEQHKAASSMRKSPSAEDLASGLADSTKQALGHAQSSLETVQQNWSSLLAETSRWADDAGLGAPRHQTDAPFGTLWNDAMPRFELFKAGHKQHKFADDLRIPGRHITIVTTATLPWMTGTAINPLLRAFYLSEHRTPRQITLAVPWLCKNDQERVYPHNLTFESPEDQEKYVRNWVEQRTGRPSSGFKVSFYPARYAREKGSILPVGDLTKWIPEHEADVAVLEEPEHLNWYQHGRRWTDKFNHVVGIMHTNYLDYARREQHGGLKELFLRSINSWVCRVHTHKVIKLSNAVQRLPRQCTQFVHGVSPKFLEVGAEKSAAYRAAARRSRDGAAAAASDDGSAAGASGAASCPEEVWPRGAYFLGKVVWAKGYTELLDLLEQHKAQGQDFPMHVYGHGDDKQAVEERAQGAKLPITFHDAKDHCDEDIQKFKVFVNPSLSDVVATTTAEALAMGKFVVCADHPSNRFFSSFSNCIIYKTPEEFAQKLQYALSHDPKPLSASELSRLSWEDATERFLDAARVGPAERVTAFGGLWDNVAAGAHNALTGIEPFRINAGAGGNTMFSPQRVTDYNSEACAGGFFDRKPAQEQKQKQQQ